jgi:hypothetical protein
LENFKDYITNTSRTRGVGPDIKLEVFKMVGLRVGKKPLNLNNLLGLESMWQLATMSEGCWHLFCQIADHMLAMGITPTDNQFKPLQGCPMWMKRMVLGKVIEKNYDIKHLKSDATRRKHVEKVNYFYNI